MLLSLHFYPHPHGDRSPKWTKDAKIQWNRLDMPRGWREELQHIINTHKVSKLCNCKKSNLRKERDEQIGGQLWSITTFRAQVLYGSSRLSVLSGPVKDISGIDWPRSEVSLPWGVSKHALIDTDDRPGVLETPDQKLGKRIDMRCPFSSPSLPSQLVTVCILSVWRQMRPIHAVLV